MTPEEYMDQRGLLLKQRNRCAEAAIKNNMSCRRLQSKIDKLDRVFEAEFHRPVLRRPEAKLQQYGVD